MSTWEKRTGLLWSERLIFEGGSPGHPGLEIGRSDVPEPAPEELIPEGLLRSTAANLPEVSEPEVVRHFSRLASWNYSVDQGFYPLGSCTMKYNPKVNEFLSSLTGFSMLHPEVPEEECQGALRLMFELSQYLAQISGMDEVTLQPAAGAQGELTGMLMVRAYHEDRGKPREKVLIPDTAHGTNPSSASHAGYKVQEIPTDHQGILSPEVVAGFMDQSVAALMLTNPNTLGLFESHISEISEIVHKAGGLVYCDGANLNALMGIARPGDMGVDLMQFNLHKTFSTPHGGGGPGAGPVGVKKILEPFLPVPRIERRGQGFVLECQNQPKSIGKVTGYYGNFAVMVKAYAYIRRLGAKGLLRASRMALLNANYLRVKLRHHYHIPHSDYCMHECVFSDKNLPNEVITMDVAKRLMDYGFHPPTIYFPLVVHGAMMIEPTETESKATLDEFISAMARIKEEAETTPDIVKSAPHNTPVARLDEVQAARHPRLRWKP